MTVPKATHPPATEVNFATKLITNLFLKNPHLLVMGGALRSSLVDTVSCSTERA
jgi:hypothetical protein